MSTPTQNTAPVTSNSRIAKNAVMLYIRMFFTMIVGLYTSRVVLNTLGVEDYGIYGVVGGIVAMMGFLNASMSGATSRFLTFELGRGDQERLAKTFSSAMIVHIGIALIVLILAETVGLWFLCNKLVIPAERMSAAHWVYQLSIASAMLTITQVPYNSAIIAHEKMDIYAYVEILNSILKLAIVFMLGIGGFDKLKLYAVLLFLVNLLILLIYRVYCIRKFDECHFHNIWDKSILKPLLSFSGWNLYGNFGGVVQQQGTNFVINFFFGVVANAAVNIAFTVANIVNQFSSNVMTAFRPQIIKYYSLGDKIAMRDLTILAITLIMCIYSVVAIPVYVEAENLLTLWLIEVPSHAVLICRLILISVFFETIRYLLIIDIHASGNVKWVSFSSGTTFVLVPLVAYLCFRYCMHIQAAFVTVIIANIILCVINVSLIKHYIDIAIGKYVVAIVKVVLASFAVLVFSIYIKSLLPSTYLNIITNTIIAVTFVGLTYFVFCFEAHQRQYVIRFVRNKFHL